MGRIMLKHIPLRPTNRFVGLVELLHWIFVALFLTDLLLVWARLVFQKPFLCGSSWPEGLLVVLALATTLTSLTRSLPGQNVLLGALGIVLAAGAVQALGALTGIPFGPFVYEKRFGPQLFDVVAWPVPLIWVVVLLNARGVARLILRPWRMSRVYGFWVIGVSVLLTILLDLGLEPFGSQVMGYWTWKPTKISSDWYGTPWVNFLGWAVSSLLILVFVTPALINKRPVQNPPEYYPLVSWLLFNLLFLTGAAQHQFRVAVVLGCAQVLALLILALVGHERSARERVGPWVGPHSRG